MTPTSIHWFAAAFCLFATRSLPIPWFRLTLLLTLFLDIVYDPAQPAPNPIALTLCALLLAKLAASLEAYSLITTKPAWKYGAEIYWPLVFAAFGLTLLAAHETGYRPELLYILRYAKIWLALFMLLAVSFVSSYRPACPPWALLHAMLVCALLSLQALGSLRYLMGLTGNEWQELNRQLYLTQAAVLGCISLVGLRAPAPALLTPRNG